MQLTPEQINEFISKSVLESQIGKAVQDAVERSIVELSKGYNNPFDTVIRNEVAILIEKEVAATYRPVLEEKIKESVAFAMTEEVMNNIVQSATKRLTGRDY